MLRFSFWGAGSTNYGNELLELACNFLVEFPEDLCTAVLNNYLVNTTGLRGHWLELDLLQEHFNFWIKRLFNSKSHDFDAKHLAEAVGLNIGGFSALRDRFPGLFGIKKNSHTHTDAATLDDINALGGHYRTEKILVYVKGRSQPYMVKDEWAEGYNILEAGQLKTFLARTMKDGPALEEDISEGVVPDTDRADSRTAVETVPAPPSPITLLEGIMEQAEFITGE